MTDAEDKENIRSQQVTIELIIPRQGAHEPFKGISKRDYQILDTVRRLKRSVDYYMKQVNGECRLYIGDYLLSEGELKK